MRFSRFFIFATLALAFGLRAQAQELSTEGLGTFALKWSGHTPPAALVRFHGQSLDSKAYVLGCGHCNGMPVGSYVADRALAKANVYLHGKDGRMRGIPVERIVYGTQTAVDLVLLELGRTYREIEAELELQARLIAPKRPPVGTPIAFYNLEKIQYCRIDEHRARYEFNEDGTDYLRDALLYRECVSLAGHSGSILIARETNEIVGLNVGGASPETPTRNFGSEVASLYECLNANRRFDVLTPGCPLRIGEKASALSTDDLTIMDLPAAQALYARVAAIPDIPFGYPDGCFAKAQKIAMLLEEEGIITGKAFVEGNLFHYLPGWGEQFWTFHVAPTILVKVGGAVVPYVLDPFLAGRLMTHEEWLKLVGRDRRTTVKKKYLTNRFVYDPTQVERNPTAYNPVLVRDMELVFEQIRRRLRARGR